MLTSIRRWITRFSQLEDGPTAVEYSIMLALIIVVCIGAVSTFGGNVNSIFGTAGRSLGSASS